MKIIDMLKNISNMRITVGDRWLCWNSFGGGWTVFEHKSYERNTAVIIETTDEDKAVDELLNGY